jgi:hypothetical protein
VLVAGRQLRCNLLDGHAPVCYHVRRAGAYLLQYLRPSKQRPALSQQCQRRCYHTCTHQGVRGPATAPLLDESPVVVGPEDQLHAAEERGACRWRRVCGGRCSLAGARARAGLGLRMLRLLGRPRLVRRGCTLAVARAGMGLRSMLLSICPRAADSIVRAACRMLRDAPRQQTLPL